MAKSTLPKHSAQAFARACSESPSQSSSSPHLSSRTQPTEFRRVSVSASHKFLLLGVCAAKRSMTSTTCSPPPNLQALYQDSSNPIQSHSSLYSTTSLVAAGRVSQYLAGATSPMGISALPRICLRKDYVPTSDIDVLLRIFLLIKLSHWRIALIVLCYYTARIS